MTIDCFYKKVQYWAVAVVEMIIATASWEAFTSHVISLFWAVVMTVVIYFVNRYLKKKFK